MEQDRLARLATGCHLVDDVVVQAAVSARRERHVLIGAHASFLDDLRPLLAVGDNGGVSQVCISLSGHDLGHVYEWTWPEETPIRGSNCPTMDYISWVAPDFRAFWDALRPMGEEEWMLWN